LTIWSSLEAMVCLSAYKGLRPSLEGKIGQIAFSGRNQCMKWFR
jgi:hypothetical protein